MRFSILESNHTMYCHSTIPYCTLLLKDTRVHLSYNPYDVYTGEVMFQIGDTGEGIEAFERAVELAPNDENLLLSAAHRLR